MLNPGKFAAHRVRIGSVRGFLVEQVREREADRQRRAAVVTQVGVARVPGQQAVVGVVERQAFRHDVQRLAQSAKIAIATGGVEGDGADSGE